MIGKLRGRIDQCDPDGQLLLDVGGVGYLLHCSQRTLAALPGVGEAAVLWVETQVREDAITLYGFATQAEQRAFRLLTTVQGVAARMALAVLSTLSSAELASAIAAQDKAMLSRAKGVGPKLAARIVTELKDKAVELTMRPAMQVAPATASPVSPAAPANDTPALAQAAPSADESEAVLLADTVSALANLGFGRSEAFQVVTELRRQQPDIADMQALVPAALRKLAVVS